MNRLTYMREFTRTNALFFILQLISRRGHKTEYVVSILALLNIESMAVNSKKKNDSLRSEDTKGEKSIQKQLLNTNEF